MASIEAAGEVSVEPCSLFLSGNLMPDFISVYFHLFRHVYKIDKSYYQLHLVCLSTRNNLAATGQIFMEFDI
jgi:hypothetical protein